jgi:hypothetical protein
MVAMTSVVVVCGEVIAAAVFAQLLHRIVGLFKEKRGRARRFLVLDDGKMR